MHILLFYLCLVVCLWTPGADCHPQCLNFGPPFRDQQVSYCSEYKDYGCCWRVTDRRSRKVVDKFSDVLSRGSDEVVVEACQPYLRNISCLPCNPYAAHIFDVETSLVRRPFPWLCEDYCVTAYRHCHSVLLPMFDLQHKDFGLSPNPANLSVLQDDAIRFCRQVNPTTSPYCYPQILDGPQLPEVDPQERTGDLNCVCAQPVATGLRNPVVATHSGDGTGRLFIVEQLGVILVLTAENNLLSQPFLDIQSQVRISGSRGDERGLLGLAFHPNYTSNGKFYVYYTTLNFNARESSRVSEFTVSSADSNIANASSERELWMVQQPASNHNGGQLLFHDNYLFIFLGDGGGANDVFQNGLNRATWHGSILRIDVDRPDPSRGTAYSIPPDNPFLGMSNVQPEIYAYGLRNPWRCSVDRGDRETGEGRGRLFCADVGQGSFEEVDIIVSGGNYGWGAFEGNQCFDRDLCNDESLGPFIPPIDTYPRSVGVSVTGGYVYRGCLYPNLHGLYIFSDYQGPRPNPLLVLREVENEAGDVRWERSELCLGDSSTCIGSLAGREDRARFVLSFGEDEDGELYVLAVTSAIPTARLGTVYQIVDPARRESPTRCRTRRSL